MSLEGLYLEGLIHGGAYFRNFTVLQFIRYLIAEQSRKRKRHESYTELKKREEFRWIPEC